MAWYPGWLQVLDQHIVAYVAQHPNSAVVLPRLWRSSPSLVLQAMVQLYHTDATTISHSLDLCQVEPAHHGRQTLACISMLLPAA